ncbi:SufE family protein [Gilvimarinus agarilyticus]|uniref:SufE family protein n=1 Tax=unclassified Gilvimarinus TaxID=2642066 RepID=UPI001C096BCF|nr:MULTISPECIES: SufE family protein [unclassified Gilvimarinus]MBU2887309.1 SufE family protein [Gilvimarinus agarilyticus]MDO6571968.1 SufE family protein [Gilvimarinus sp. 2_MG-2023]MDO6746036.1 SufE family protein [Gilvimarinus sp. 1_MG-2023]
MTEFGVDVSAEDIVDTLSFFDDWEERYKYIIDLGKELPPLAESAKTEQNLVRGCQSQVWLDSQLREGKLYFVADSDAFIVKGLLAIVLAAYNGKSAAQVADYDIDAYFDELNLLSHLSSTRGNGLKAMVQRIQNEGRAAL